MASCARTGVSHGHGHARGVRGAPALRFRMPLGATLFGFLGLQRAMNTRFARARWSGAHFSTSSGIGGSTKCCGRGFGRSTTPSGCARSRLARHQPIRGAHTVCSALLRGIASGGSASHSSHASTAMRRGADEWGLRDVLWRRLFPSPPRRARVRTPANDEQEGSRGAAEDPPRSAEQQPQDGHRRCVDSRAAAAPPPRSPRRRSRCAQACRTWASRPCSTFSRR